MKHNRFSPAPGERGAPGTPGAPPPSAGGFHPAATGRTVALVCAIGLAATVAPVAIAAGLSSAQGKEAKVLETVRTVTLGGESPSFAAAFDLPGGAPDCTREVSLTIGARQFTCGGVTIETRSADDVEDLPRFGVRAIRAKLFADAPAPDMRPAVTPRAPGMIAWTGSPVADMGGVMRGVIVLGDDASVADEQGGAGKEKAGEQSAAEGEKADGDEKDDATGSKALVAIVSGDAAAVEEAMTAILAGVRPAEATGGGGR